MCLISQAIAFTFDGFGEIRPEAAVKELGYVSEITSCSEASVRNAMQFLLVSDFNLANLSVLLSKDADSPAIQAFCAPFGQAIQTLLRPEPGIWAESMSGAIVWTTPQSASPGFQRLIEGGESEPDELLRDVDAFCRAVSAIPPHIKYVFVPTWILAPFEGRLGLLDMDERRGVSLALLRMNAQLASNFQGDPRVFVLDTARWVAVHGEQSFNSRLWYMSKTPYSVELFREAVLEIRAAVGALAGKTRKLIVLDLDNTLWGGIVGDVGWQNLRLGGHDPVGEGFLDFQRALKVLKSRGILLGILSKNDESNALEAIRKHPEMALRMDDFVGWRINWNDKAQGMLELLSELNLGQQSVVFIDDNPVERGRIQTALPEVLVPEWPANPMQFKTALQRLRCFDQAQISLEDRQRSEMYVTESKRRETLGTVESLEDWLLGLQMKVTVEPLSEANLDRAIQLLNKTNQMNLSTRRLSKNELWEWSQRNENVCICFRVADRLGDYGLVGLASLTLQSGTLQATVTDFILSCRVMGRKVEETMVHVLSNRARVSGKSVLRAIYQPTSKNEPCRRFLENSGMHQSGHESEFILNVTVPYPLPKPICLELYPGWEDEGKTSGLALNT